MNNLNQRKLKISNYEAKINYFIAICNTGN